MRTNIPVIFAIVLFLALILATGCVTPSSDDQKARQDTGPATTDQRDSGFARISEGSPYIRFDDAYQSFREYIPDPADNTSTAVKTVYYIHGTDMDRAGNASGWIFGARHAGGSSLLSYDRRGWVQVPWDASLIAEEIDVPAIVAPDKLFSQNIAVIQTNPARPERLDLDLIRGVYTLTLTSGSTERILNFNATTGKLITLP